MDIATRAWTSKTTPTVVLWRKDIQPMVWLCTNAGWIPIGNTPEDSDAAESFAEEMAEEYQLAECHHSEALYLVGIHQ